MGYEQVGLCFVAIFECVLVRPDPYSVRTQHRLSGLTNRDEIWC